MVPYILAYLLILLAFVAVGYALCWMAKWLGYPKLGKGLLVGSYVLFLSLTLYVVFEDQLFSKSDAEELLTEQNIKLNDEFELIKNESMSAIGDYCHTFTLKITEKDKRKIISLISNSSDFSFKKDENWIDDSLFRGSNRYTGRKIIRNYRTQLFFVRELFEPQGNGYIPKFRKIKIDKRSNTLVFEDIEE